MGLPVSLLPPSPPTTRYHLGNAPGTWSGGGVFGSAGEIMRAVIKCTCKMEFALQVWFWESGDTPMMCEWQMVEHW